MRPSSRLTFLGNEVYFYFMYYYKATIRYNGTGYAGFQWQKDAPTIQNDFNLSLKRILPGKVTTQGASRTDTGVHALEQVVKISAESPIATQTLLRELKRKLPDQIECLDISTCEGSFKPALHPKTKEYRYYFTNLSHHALCTSAFIANFSPKLDISLMQKCASLIIGEHNFHNFCSTGSNVKSTVRVISACELTETDFFESDFFKVLPEQKRCYQLRIVGNGFLKQMVRHLMSSLWLVGSGKMTVEDFSTLLYGSKQEKRKWKTATPKGLFLYRINYV